MTSTTKNNRPFDRYANVKRWLNPFVAALMVSACGENIDTASRQDIASVEQADTEASTSPPTTMMQFVKSMGFLDGVTCDSWPRNIALTDYPGVADMVAAYISTGNTVVEPTAWLSTQAQRLGVGTLTAIGSSDELVLAYPNWSALDGPQPVVVDVRKGVAYAAAQQWLCNEQDLEAQECETVTVNSAAFGRLALLKRRTKYQRGANATEPRRTWLLVAPSVRLADSLTLDVGLVVVADQIIGGPPLSEGENLVNRAGSVSINVTPYARAIASTWSNDLNASTIPGLLALMANRVGGVSDLKVTNGERISSAKVADYGTSNGPTIDTGSRTLTVPANSFMPATRNDVTEGAATVIWSQNGQGSGDPRDVRIALEWVIPLTKTIDLQLPAVRHAWEAGGAAFLTAAEGPTPGLSANAAAPVSVSAVSSLTEYAKQLAGSLAVPCTDSTRAEGGGWVSYFERKCKVLRTINLNYTLNGAHKTYTISNPTQIVRDHESEYASPMADLLATRLSAILASLNGPTTSSVTGSTATFGGYERSMLAGQLFSRGLLFESLVNGAEAESLASGVYSPRYSTIASLGQAIVPALGGVYVDQNSLENVQRIARYLTLAGEGTSGLVNALGLPYGRIAQGWYPDGTSGRPNAVSEITQRWRDVGELVQDLQMQINLSNSQDAVTLAGKLGTLVGHSQEVSAKVTDAANAQAVDGERTIQKLTESFAKIEELQNKLTSDWVGNWNCLNQNLEGCAVTIPAKVEALVNRCQPPQNGDQFIVDMIDFATTAVPLISAAYSGVELGKSIGEQFKDWKLLSTKQIADLDQLKKILESMEKWKKAAETAKSLFDGLAAINKMTSSECDRQGNEYIAMQNVMANLMLFQGQLDALAAQATLVQTLTDSYIQAVKTWGLIGQAAKDFGTDAQTLQDELTALANDQQNWQTNQNRFIKTACKTAQRTVRAAQADLHHLSQMLQTSVGRANTSADLTLPAYPESAATGTQDERQSFYLSLWDSSGFSGRFCTDAVCTTQSFAQKAAARFNELVSNQICGGRQDYPAIKFLVRKVLGGEVLNQLKRYGRADFTLDLNDVIAGGNVMRQGPGGDTRFSPVAIYRDGDSSTKLDVTSPVVLAAAYSGCVGTDPNDPCCTGASCRTSFTSVSYPALVGQGWHQVAGPCAETAAASEWTGTRAAGIDKHVGTCPVQVSSPRFLVEMQDMDGSSQLPALMQTAVNSPICGVISQDVQFARGRGLPVMGAWTIAHNAQHANTITTMVAPPSNPGDPAPVDPELAPNDPWRVANAGLTGVEVLFFVGAEVRNPAQDNVYFYADQIGSTLPLERSVFGFENVTDWTAPNATLTSSTTKTEGTSSLSVQGGGFVEISAKPVSSSGIAAGATHASFDLLIPTQQPNPWWIGASQMYITIPSANLYNVYLGQVELTSLPRGSFTTLTFSLPGQVVSALTQFHDDVQIKIALNINAGTPAYLVDNLRFD